MVPQCRNNKKYGQRKCAVVRDDGKYTQKQNKYHEKHNGCVEKFSRIFACFYASVAASA